MLKPFLKLVSLAEALDKMRRFGSIETETVPMERCLARVLSHAVISSQDLPEFNRSTMDGFAVRAKDTFGASESAPLLFKIIGEVHMGEISDLYIQKGECVRIWTGGALPVNANAVVMIEHTEELDTSTLEISRAVAPLDNVVKRGEDFLAGEELLHHGHRMRPSDIGLLAALGIDQIDVFKVPIVAVISSGDEIVPIEQEPQPGCVRDINRHTISAMIQEAYCASHWIGIAADQLKVVAECIEKALESSDIVIISGGSSMGSRDHVIEAIRSYPDAEILIHGVSVSPGKPFILGRIGHKPIIGLPGHPVSAMICFEQLVTPLLRHIGGEKSALPFLRSHVKAVLSKNIPSKEGRTDFIRVKVEPYGYGFMAYPIPGKSGAISAMVRAQGYVRIEADCEGYYKGDVVDVHLFSTWLGENLETQYLFGHEVTTRSSEALLGPAQQEKLSITGDNSGN